MNKLFKFIALPLITALSACGSTTKKVAPKSNAVVIASWGEYFSDKNIKMLEEKTGVEIKLVEYSSNEVLYKEMDSNNYDIIIPSEYMVDKLIEEDKLQKITFDSLGVAKSELLPPVVEAIDNYKDGKLWDYSIPLVVGDIRLHVNPKVLSKIAGSIDGEYIDLQLLFETKDIKIGLQEDARNIAWLAMNYKFGQKIDSFNAVNPDLDKAEEALESLFKLNDKFVFGDETIIPEQWVAGDVDMFVGYNTDPLWSLKSADDYPNYDSGFGEERNYKSFKIRYNSNLFIDNLAITKSAKEDAQKVAKAIFENYDSLSLAESYNPVFTLANDAAINKYSGQDLETFLLYKGEKYYSLFTPDKNGDKNYSEKISKLFSKYRS